MMNWEAIGAVAEFVGAFAVVITLIYLISQLRQNTKALRSSSYASIHQQEDNFFGSQVNRAARVEPIAVPGSVLVTEQCACMLVRQDNGDFDCEYLGTQELAKKYGSGKLYRLRRSHELE